jgi:hypothetical protein
VLRIVSYHLLSINRLISSHDLIQLRTCSVTRIDPLTNSRTPPLRESSPPARPTTSPTAPVFSLRTSNRQSPAQHHPPTMAIATKTTAAQRSIFSAATRTSSTRVVRLLPAVRCLNSSATARATSPIPPRKQMTLRTGDPSTKKWAELTGGQKVVRTASTGLNAATILVGLALTVGAHSRRGRRLLWRWMVTGECAGRRLHIRLPGGGGPGLGHQLVQPSDGASQGGCTMQAASWQRENQGIW